MPADQSAAGSTGPSIMTPDLVVVREPDSDGAQAYRSVRETIRHARSDPPVRSVLLADAGSRDQAGEVIANVGASFALNGSPTVLVDADGSNPSLHRLLNTPLSPGLIERLSSGSANPLSTAVASLSVIPVGTRADSTVLPLADLLSDETCQQLVTELTSSARYVLFNATVAPVSSEALTIAANVDAVLLLVRSSVTRRTDAQRARESLERVGANILGAVLTDSR